MLFLYNFCSWPLGTSQAPRRSQDQFFPLHSQLHPNDPHSPDSCHICPANPQPWIRQPSLSSATFSRQLSISGPSSITRWIRCSKMYSNFSGDSKTLEIHFFTPHQFTLKIHIAAVPSSAPPLKFYTYLPLPLFCSQLHQKLKINWYEYYKNFICQKLSPISFIFPLVSVKDFPDFLLKPVFPPVFSLFPPQVLDFAPPPFVSCIYFPSLLWACFPFCPFLETYKPFLSCFNSLPRFYFLLMVFLSPSCSSTILSTFFFSLSIQSTISLQKVLMPKTNLFLDLLLRFCFQQNLKTFFTLFLLELRPPLEPLLHPTGSPAS